MVGRPLCSLAILALAVGGCGGDDSGASDDGTETTDGTEDGADEAGTEGADTSDATSADDSTTTSTTGDTGDETETGTETETDGETDTGTTGPLDDVVRLDHIQVKGSHNSYHQEPAIPFDASHEYTHAPLDVQLGEYGVRAFEIDVHQGGGGLEVYHIAVIDAVSSCDTFQDCLLTIKGWSDANPLHVPITVWIEVKDDTGGSPINDMSVIDDEIRMVFDEEQLFTPDDLQDTYSSPRERIETEGWPLIADVRGQVMFVVLDGSRAEEYTDGFTSLAGKAMFQNSPSDHYYDGWAVMTKINDPASSGHAAAHDAQLMIASNTCGADQSADDCQAELEAGFANGVHFLKDDFPGPVDGEPYYMDFPDGNPVRCNEVRSTTDCTAEGLEDLP